MCDSIHKHGIEVGPDAFEVIKGILQEMESRLNTDDFYYEFSSEMAGFYELAHSLVFAHSGQLNYCPLHYI